MFLNQERGAIRSKLMLGGARSFRGLSRLMPPRRPYRVLPPPPKRPVAVVKTSPPPPPSPSKRPVAPPPKRRGVSAVRGRRQQRQRMTHRPAAAARAAAAPPAGFSPKAVLKRGVSAAVRGRLGKSIINRIKTQAAKVLPKGKQGSSSSSLLETMKRGVKQGVRQLQPALSTVGKTLTQKAMSQLTSPSRKRSATEAFMAEDNTLPLPPAKRHAVATAMSSSKGYRGRLIHGGTRQSRRGQRGGYLF